MLTGATLTNIKCKLEFVNIVILDKYYIIRLYRHSLERFVIPFRLDLTVNNYLRASYAASKYCFCRRL